MDFVTLLVVAVDVEALTCNSFTSDPVHNAALTALNIQDQ